MRLPAFCPAAASAAPASVVYLRLVLENYAGGGVDLVAVRHAAGLELDLVAREGSFCISKSSLLLCGFTKRRLCYRLPSPVIRVIHGKDDLLHLELNNS